MAATPTRLEKTLARRYIPPVYDEVEEQVCYTPPSGGGGTPSPPPGGSNCQIVITRVVVLTQAGAVSLLPGEFILRTDHEEGKVTFTIAKRVCT